MVRRKDFSEFRLLNGSVGDPCLFVDAPGRDNALLFDCGDNHRLSQKRLADLEALFITHHHIDHFIGFDRILRANIDASKDLRVFGPEGSIDKIYQRIRSYEFQYYPFQQIRFHVHEILEDRIRDALLCCKRRFPAPEIRESKRRGTTVFQSGPVRVDAVLTEHTVPCVAYALIEAKAFQLDKEKVARGALRPGPWIGQTLAHADRGAPKDTEIEIEGGRFELGVLLDRYFRPQGGSKIAYVTDTCWTESTAPRLKTLARKADRLYCDSYYSQTHAKQASKYKHMTATHAAQFAKEAKVGQLILMHFAPRYRGRFDRLVREAQEIFPNTSAFCSLDEESSSNPTEST